MFVTDADAGGQFGPQTTAPTTPQIPNTYSTQIPGAFGASGYADSALAANNAYANTLARINQKRSSSLRQAGYLGDVDSKTGMVGNLRVDPNNPYGGLQSMLRTQAGDFQQAQFAAEDRGLHGGLAHKADSDLKYQHGAQAAQFGTDFTDQLGGFQDEQNQAAYSRDSALAEAELQAARDAIDAQSFNPGDYSGLSYAPYGADPVVADSKAMQVAKKVTAKKTTAASSAAKALAARSAALNKKYGLGR